MAKKIISELSAEIQNYTAKTEPLSISPILDGGIKQDILNTLNNKAYNAAYLRLSALPTNVFLTPEQGNNGEYSIYTQAPLACILLKKEGGVWNVVEKSNTMAFFFDDNDGTRYYYAFSDDLKNPIQTHSINFSSPTGKAILTTPQTLTEEEKIQAQTNINAASKSYIDEAIENLKNSTITGGSAAGSVMPWFGTEATIPQDWMLIPNEETFLLKADYPDLYAALGGENNVFGVTDTLFGIPFIEGGSSIVHSGEDFALGQTGGETEHTLTVNEIPEHSHIIHLGDLGGSEITSINTTNANTTEGGSVQTETSGGGLAHNNMPPYIVANYIIKTKNSGGAADIAKASYISGNSTRTVSKLATLIELDIDSSEETPISFYCNLVIRRITGAEHPPTLATSGNKIDIFGITRESIGGALINFNQIKSYLSGFETFVGDGAIGINDRLSFSWGENNAGGKLWIIIPAPMHSFKVEAFASKRLLEDANIEREVVENIVTRIIPIDYDENFVPVPFIRHITDVNATYLNAAKIPNIDTVSGDATKFFNQKGEFATIKKAVNSITGATSGATYNILKGMNVITNCLAAGTHIFNLPTPIEGVENLMTVKFRTCSTAPTITRVVPKLQGVGTISNTANSPILTGVGTTFTELRSGDKIYYNEAEREVLSVTSDLEITLVNNVVDANTDESWEYYTPIRIFGGVTPVWGISEVRTIFYEYVKYGNTWYLEISYSSNAN